MDMSEQVGRPNRIEIQGQDSLVLKQLIEADAPRYFDLIDFDREHLSQFGDETTDKYQTVEDVTESIRNPKPDRLRFGIWDGEAMVGSINSTLVGENAAEIGYWVGAEYLRRGYASRALAELSRYEFERQGMERLVAFVVVGNVASRGVLEKSGYRLTKTVERHGRQEWLLELTRPGRA